MIVVLRTWFGERSVRERRMLLAMAAIGIPLLLWLALIVPIDRAYDRALERQLEAVDRHARTMTMAERARGSRATAAPSVPDLSLFLIDSARQAGLTAVPSAAPATVLGTGAAIVTIASADARAALGWLSGLEAQGYVIDNVRISSSPNGQVAVTASIGGVR